MAKSGNEIEVVAPYDPAIKECEPQPIPIHRFRYIWPARLHIMGHGRSLVNDMQLRPLVFFLLPFYLLAAFITLMRVTSRQHSQAIHAHWVIPSGWVAAWVASLRHIPLMINLHGSDIFVARSNALFRFIARWSISKAAFVSTCSPELQQAAQALGAPKTAIIIPHGANPEIFNPNLRRPRRYASFGIEDERIIIVALGRLVNKKGFCTLIDAMSLVVKQAPQVHLLLGGEGSLKNKLRLQAKSLGILSHISLVGNISWSEVPDFLANADIFVLPSIRDERGNVDGLPTVLLEAMSSGVAIVASDIAGVSLVIEDNKNGILVPPGDAPTLAKVILDLVHEQSWRLSLGQAARRDIETTYNWDRIAHQYIRLLETAVWRNNHSSRIGAAYREEMLARLEKSAEEGYVLDVGCHNGLFLSGLNASIRIGVDINPIPGAPGVLFVRADGNWLPFKANTFNFVYALDVIEHVIDDRAFAESLCRVVAPKGKLFVSTPSARIQIFPPFLTRWISRKWGHTLRTGYEADELSALFSNQLKIRITTWNAPFFRLLYLPVRFLFSTFPRLALSMIKHIASLDGQHSCGVSGFLVLEGEKEAQ